MDGYIGYALKAGVEGFQTGMNLAQKKTEMDWQKKQQKKLEEMEAKLTEEAALYNSVVTQAGADGFYSEDDIMKINTTYLALGHLTQERIKGAHDALISMDKAAFDREMEYFNGTIDLLKSGLLDPKDASAVFEYGRNNWATSEKVQNLYEAADNIYAKTHGEVQEERVWKRAETIPSERRVPFIEKELGIEMPEAEVTPTVPSVAQRKYDWATEAYQKWLKDPKDPEGINFEEYKKYMGVSVTTKEATGLKKQIKDIVTEGERAGIDPAKINKAIQDKILGKEAGALTPTPTSVENIREDIKNAPTIEDAKRIEKNHIAKYGDTTGIPNVDKFWSDERVNRLTSLKQGIDKLLDEKKRLKKGSITSAEVGFEIEDDIQKVEEVYKQLREEYMKYRDMLEKMGVDVSQFPEMMSYDEYIKTDVKPKVIYDPRTWGGQKPAVY